MSGLETRVLPLAARLVPVPRRNEWVREWRAELWHLKRDLGHEGGRAAGRDVMRNVSLAYGLVADAAWLRVDWARETAQASAYSCLWMLGMYCLLCAAMERMVADSWMGFFATVYGHFSGMFVLVAVPAVMASVATYPLRPLRCNGPHSGAGRRLSARARWNLFLAAKVLLTLMLAFLVSLVATGPVRMMAGRMTDWFELGMYALAVTAGMRWALLDQEQRCQRCLRMLGEPTRVGPPSRNFLEWSGMEQACADGHGRLHVAQMQGSWCWYDLWVELDSGWVGWFGG